MIGITQWRAVIGCWYNRLCRGMSFSIHLCNISRLISLFIYICLMSSHGLCIILLLLLCGDVHTNPGPDDVIKALRFCHVNARSILKSGRLEELYLELCSLHEFDVIGISESHLDSKIPDVDVEFNNYSVFRSDRNRQGGGVALYVRSSLACVRRYDLETPDTEMLWAEITSNHKRILVGVCYRSPSQILMIDVLTGCPTTKIVNSV